MSVNKDQERTWPKQMAVQEAMNAHILTSTPLLDFRPSSPMFGLPLSIKIYACRALNLLLPSRLDYQLEIFQTETCGLGNYLVSLGYALFFTRKHTNSNIPRATRTETNVEWIINYLIQEMNKYTMLRWYACMYLCRYANANVPINTEFWID